MSAGKLRLASFLLLASLFLPVSGALAKATTRLLPLDRSQGGGRTEAVIYFDKTRDAKTRTLIFKVAGKPAAVTNLGVVPTELQARDGRSVIPATSVVAALSTNKAVPSLLTLTATVDPKDAPNGTYRGKLLLRGADITPSRVRIRVVLTGRGHPLWLAFIVIFGGVLGAGIVQWLQGTAIKLRTARRRFAQLSRTVARAQPNVPNALLLALQIPRETIDWGDPDGASKALDELEQGIKRVVTPATVELIAQAFDSLDYVDHSIRRLADLEDVQINHVMNTLKSVHGDLNTSIEANREALWPGGDTAGLETSLKHLKLFARYLTQLLDADSRGRTRLVPIAPLFANDHYDDAEKRLNEEVPAPAAEGDDTEPGPGLAARAWGFLQPTATGDVVLPPPSPPHRPDWPARLWAMLREGPRGWVIEHSPTFSFLAIAAIVSVIGLEHLYSDSPTFGSWKDWLTLAGWGFGAQITGVTIAQLGAHFTPKGTGI